MYVLVGILNSLWLDNRSIFIYANIGQHVMAISQEIPQSPCSDNNRPISEIPQCACPISQTSPFITEIWTFLLWKVHCRLWYRCMVGFFRVIHQEIFWCPFDRVFKVRDNPKMYEYMLVDMCSDIGNTCWSWAKYDYICMRRSTWLTFPGSDKGWSNF